MPKLTTSLPKLPALHEFSPETLGGPGALFELLSLINAEPNREVVVEVIQARWFARHASARAGDPLGRSAMQRKLAGNVIAGMRQAGLLEGSRKNLALSELGRELLRVHAHTGEQSALEQFATYLLRNRYGIELLEAARFVRRRDNEVGKASIVAQLRDFGFSISSGSANYSRLRDWLVPAGVVDKKWNIDEARFEALSGISAGGITEWSALSELQRRTLVILRLRAESDLTPIASKDLIDLFRIHGIPFDEAQVRRDVYAPLTSQGWITHVGVGNGRGGNGGTIAPTRKTLDLDVEKIEDLKLGLVPPDLREKLATSLDEIFRDLGDSDKHVKGLALELLALRLVGEAGLFPVELRKRGVETGGAEVDLLAEGAHLHFSRWLFQCKNVDHAVGVEVLAKELGMATLLRAQVVVILSMGGFTKTVRDLAREAVANTAVQVILFDAEALGAYRRGGSAAVRSELHTQAVQVLALKRPQRKVPSD